jgi:septal ring factor EnvC (AmiA/AmiB activator)
MFLRWKNSKKRRPAYAQQTGILQANYRLASRKQVYALIIFLSLFISIGYAADNKKSELGKIASKIAEIKDLIFKKKSEENDLTNDLRKIELQINTINIRLNSIAQQIDVQQQKLTSSQKLLQQNQQQLEVQRTALAQQFRTAYEMGQHSYWRVLLNQDDPEKISRILTYYQYLNQARTNLITDMQASIATIEQTQQQIASQTLSLQKLQQERVAQKNDLHQQEQDRRQVLVKLTKEIKTQQQRLAQLEINRKNLERVVNSLDAHAQYQLPSGVGFAKLRGRLTWPVAGRVGRGYASVSDGNVVSRGIFFSATIGVPVHAVAPGEVIFADWLRGYGLLMIVSHGDQYLTLYAHNNALLKHVGDKVIAGDAIALVGDSGGADYPGLYFEMRAQGKPIDPTRWFKKRL